MLRKTVPANLIANDGSVKHINERQDVEVSFFAMDVAILDV